MEKLNYLQTIPLSLLTYSSWLPMVDLRSKPKFVSTSPNIIQKIGILVGQVNYYTIIFSKNNDGGNHTTFSCQRLCSRLNLIFQCPNQKYCQAKSSMGLYRMRWDHRIIKAKRKSCSSPSLSSKRRIE